MTRVLGLLFLSTVPSYQLQLIDRTDPYPISSRSKYGSSEQLRLLVHFRDGRAPIPVTTTTYKTIGAMIWGWHQGQKFHCLLRSNELSRTVRPSNPVWKVHVDLMPLMRVPLVHVLDFPLVNSVRREFEMAIIPTTVSTLTVVASHSFVEVIR